MSLHDPLPGYAGCTCGTEGFTATLACGHQTWTHGLPRVGQFQSCYPALNAPPGVAVFGCQAQRKVIAVAPGLPEAAA